MKRVCAFISIALFTLSLSCSGGGGGDSSNSSNSSGSSTSSDPFVDFWTLVSVSGNDPSIINLSSRILTFTIPSSDKLGISTYGFTDVTRTLDGVTCNQSGSFLVDNGSYVMTITESDCLGQLPSQSAGTYTMNGDSQNLTIIEQAGFVLLYQRGSVEGNADNIDADPHTDGPAVSRFSYGVGIESSIWMVANIDEVGTGYCVAVGDGSPAPTTKQIIAKEGGPIVAGASVEMKAEENVFCQMSGLANSTEYDIYFVAVAEDDGGKSEVQNYLMASTVIGLNNNPANMEYIMGGCFFMGDWSGLYDEDERPWHPVCLTSFWMDKYETSQIEFNTWSGGPPSVGYGFPNCGGGCPAENVSYSEASLYCSDNNKSLPTEAQWEYAARNRGLNHIFTQGSDSIIECVDENFEGCLNDSGGQTALVGQYTMNGLGLFDIGGNVNEWVLDFYKSAYTTEELTDPMWNTDMGKGRVIRGGNWGDATSALRTINRDMVAQTKRSNTVGFRCTKRVDQ